MISYPFKYSKVHDAEALLLLCIDFRFHDAAHKFMKEGLKIELYDVIEFAGAGKTLNFPENDSDFETLIEQIELSKKLHNVEKFVLMHHADCGAYGGRKAFDSVEVERQNHIDEMMRVKKRIDEKYPQFEVEVIPVFMNLDDAQKEIIPEVISV